MLSLVKTIKYFMHRQDAIYLDQLCPKISNKNWKESLHKLTKTMDPIKCYTKIFFESQSTYHSLFNLSSSKELTLVLNHH